MRRDVRARAVIIGAVLALAACSSSSTSPASSASSPATTVRATTTTASPEWAAIDHDLAALGPHVGLLAARVTAGGTCAPVHAIAPSTPRPTASQFKLFVLGALAKQIAGGRVDWNQQLTTGDATKSLGNEGAPGALELVPPGTKVSVEHTATNMIEISDNTAADMLIKLVGRDRVEAQNREWSSHASANVPFLTTREMLLLHYTAGLGARYLTTPRSGRAAFLASTVDPLPLSNIVAGYTQEPRTVDTIEWFASPADICRAFAGLQQLAKQASLAPLSTVLSRELGTIGLDRSEWPTIFFKGGSEAGVLTLGWLSVDRRGETFVVEAMVSNPEAALAADSITDLVAIARRAFGLLGS